MTRYSHILASALIASQLIVQTSPATAENGRDIIIQQQAEECRRLGGRYQYPKCYLPDRSPTERPRHDDVCDLGCRIFLSILGAVAARAAYCRINPDRC